MQTILLKTENLLKLKNYSPKTIKSYLFYINDYLNFAKQKNIKDNKPAVYLLPFKFKSWQLELMKDEEISDFLNKLCDFSELSEDFKKQLKSAVIEF